MKAETEAGSVWPPAPQFPAPGSSTLVLARQSQRADRLRLYRVVVDGQERDRIADAETKVLSLPSGLHQVELRIDWCRSPKLDVRIEANQSLRLECGSALQGWKLWFGLVYIFLFPRHYLFLHGA